MPIPAAVLAAGVGGIASLLGGLFGNKAQKDVARDQNIASAAEAARNRQFSSQEATISRNWQEQMSNSAYQRGTEDMRKAGINPMAAFLKGGASTPTGATASGSAGSMQKANIDNIGQQAVSSALDTARLKKELSNTKLINQGIKEDNKIKRTNAIREQETWKIDRKLLKLDAWLKRLSPVVSSGAQLWGASKLGGLGPRNKKGWNGYTITGTE